jgi:predicted protein tyrosine phosphatase
MSEFDERSFPRKLLFVCSRNRLRSLTAEKLFSDILGIQVRSAGTQPEARIVVNEGHIGWADVIFVMEKSHLQKLRSKFGDGLNGKKIVTLHIPDEFQFMQPELIDELQTKVAQHIQLPENL